MSENDVERLVEGSDPGSLIREWGAVPAPTASAIAFTPNGSIAATDVQAAIQEVRDEAGGGAPTTADYLVGTAQAGLSAEIVVPAAGLALLDDTTQAAQQTTLGLGTGDSPQFTGVNVGHATDTTLARASAGDLTVEGKGLYRADGTDVAVADGGTGASTAATARTNLDVLASTAARFGRTVNAGTANYQQPGRCITAVTTSNPSAIQLSYWLMWTPTVITLDLVAFNVTVTPASNALVRLGVYAADSANQPSGNPLADVEVAVANGFTGVKTAAISAVVGPGPFLACMNLNVGMQMRAYSGNVPGGHIDNAMGAGTAINFTAIAAAYGAMPAPGTAWTFDTGGLIACPIAFLVGTP